MSNQLQRFDSALNSESAIKAINAGLPAHIKPARFRRVLQTSVANDHRLLNVDPRKIISEALKIAALGLVTDPHLGEAYLIADNRGNVQCRVGYRGLIKLARQSGEIAALYAHEVCENDHFAINLGTEKRLEHTPAMRNRGEIYAFYAVAQFASSATDFEVMGVEEINAIRDASSDGWKAHSAGKIKSTPWATSYGEMAKKTVLRRLLKRLPMSADLETAVSHESRIDDDDRRFDEARDITTPPAALENPAEFVEVLGVDGEVREVSKVEVYDYLLEAAIDVFPGDRQAWVDHNRPLVDERQWKDIETALPQVEDEQ